MTDTDLRPPAAAPLRSSYSWISRIGACEEPPFSLIRQRMGWSNELVLGLSQATTEKLPDLDRAVDMLVTAHRDRIQVTVVTDYDMDGVAAGLLTYGGLNELGIQANLVVPDYRGPRDVTAAKVEQALAQYPRTGIIVTCDVGINSNEGIDRAHRDGIGVIIADHHIEGDEPCRAEAVVDPNRTGCDYPENEICGAQVSLHILKALTAVIAPHKAETIELLSLFGGIGGLADVMPLLGQTRSLTKRAVALIALSIPEIPVYTEEDTRRSEDPVKYWQIGKWNLEDPDAIDPDSSTLMQLLGAAEHSPEFVDLFRGMSIILRELICAGKVSSVEGIDHDFIGFTFAPMFNATRRIEGDMADSFSVFAPAAVRASRPDHLPGLDDSVRRALGARTIIANNETRKEMFRQALEDMKGIAQPLAPYVWFSEAAPGVLGLIAAEQLKQTGLPSVVVNPEHLAGSARAPEWIDVLATANGMGRAGLSAAGHHQACGVRAQSLDDLSALAADFDRQVDQRPQPNPEQQRATLHFVDIESLHEIDDAGMQALEQSRPDLLLPGKSALVSLATRLALLEPFGRGFPAPTIEVTFQPAHATMTMLGRRDGAKPESTDPADYKHLKVVTGHGLEIVYFNKAELIDEIKDASLATASVRLSLDSFAGRLRARTIAESITVL